MVRQPIHHKAGCSARSPSRASRGASRRSEKAGVAKSNIRFCVTETAPWMTNQSGQRESDDVCPRGNGHILLSAKSVRHRAGAHRLPAGLEFPKDLAGAGLESHEVALAVTDKE